MEDLARCYERENQLHVGVLAIIGSFVEHVNLTIRAGKALKALPDQPLKNTEVKITVVQRPDQVTDSLDALIIPGGESTVLARFLQINNFDGLLKAWSRKPNKFTWGTCAGLIVMSNRIENQGKIQPSLIGGIDITCLRNGYGRQQSSHVAELEFADDIKDEMNFDSDPKPKKFPAVFIRAPLIKSLDSGDVKVLCYRQAVKSVEDGDVQLLDSLSPVGVVQRNKMATTFHPELTDDIRWHAYFLLEALKRKAIIE